MQSHPTSPDSYDNVPDLLRSKEDGFVDLVFRIVERSGTADFHRCRLEAVHEGAAVGFELLLRKGILSAFDDKVDLIRTHVYRRGAQFLRTGAESDRLIEAVQSLYECRLPNARMVDSSTFTVIALHQGEIDFETECVRLKFFGQDDEPVDENAYYELFFQVDLAGRTAYWNEKDPDYRWPIVRGLSLSH